MSDGMSMAGSGLLPDRCVIEVWGFLRASTEWDFVKHGVKQVNGLSELGMKVSASSRWD